MSLMCLPFLLPPRIAVTFFYWLTRSIPAWCDHARSDLQAGRQREGQRQAAIGHADIDWPSDAGPLPAQEMDGPHRSSCPHVVAPVVEPFDQVQQCAVAQVGCSTVVEFGAGLESLDSLTDQDHHPVWDDDEVHRPAEVCAPPQLLP